MKTKTLTEFGFKNPVIKKECEIFINDVRYRKMKFKVEKTINIEDGKHKGTLKQINYEERKGYKYVDFVIEEDDTKLDLRCGVPQYLSENSMLGMVMKNFGCDVNTFVDKELEIEDYITVGVRVNFITIHKDKFVNILPESIKPLK